MTTAREELLPFGPAPRGGAWRKGQDSGEQKSSQAKCDMLRPIHFAAGQGCSIHVAGDGWTSPHEECCELDIAIFAEPALPVSSGLKFLVAQQKVPRKVPDAKFRRHTCAEKFCTWKCGLALTKPPDA